MKIYDFGRDSDDPATAARARCFNNPPRDSSSPHFALAHCSLIELLLFLLVHSFGFDDLADHFLTHYTD